MFERFTDQARKIVVLAQQEARELDSGRIGTEHLLLGMLRQPVGVATHALNAAGVTYDAVRAVVADRFEATGGPEGHLPFTNEAKRSLELALRESLAAGDQHLDGEHVLAGMLRVPQGATEVLGELGVDIDKLRSTLSDVRTPAMAGERDEERPRRSGEKRPRVLEQFGVNMVELARAGKLDPVLGREREIERAIQVLCRRTKANPVLVGPAGVGKTAVAEGLALAIAHKRVPENLADVELWSVDMGAMVAGTKFRGDFEERIKGLIREAGEPNVVLFIDEIHAVLGVGAGEGGGMDAGNLLKPAMSRGQLRLVGATTDDEYRIVEKDKALERRLARVDVGEPSPAVCRQILAGVRERYEDHHHLVATDEALESAVRLTGRYLPDRRLPDKAIDALDEAMARIRLRGEMRRDGEGPGAADVVGLRQRLVDAAQAVRRGEEPDTDAQLGALEALEVAEVPWQVGADEIAEVVSAMAGVPISVGDDERERLLRLEEVLHDKVVGQHDAVEAVAKTLRRVRAGLASGQRVGGAFLFVGPTGVGKTELARTLACEVLRDSDALVQLDMSEYMESHSVSRLIGSPPGYVGHGEGGQLTEAVRRKPFSVVLFDEVEKAHPDIHNLLLQLLEEGRLTDSQGRKVDFSNTIVILTSNLGTAELSRPQVGFTRATNKSDALVLHDAVRKALRPELVGRLDEIVVFHPLSVDEVATIARMMVRGVAGRLAEHGVSLEVTDAAYQVLCAAGYDRSLGARPMRRTVQNLVEDRLATAVLEGVVRAGQMAVLDADGDGGLTLSVVDGGELSEAADEAVAQR